MKTPRHKLGGTCQQRLAQHRLGRVTLHLACIARNPGNTPWHWKGIIRELVPSRAH